MIKRLFKDYFRSNKNISSHNLTYDSVNYSAIRRGNKIYIQKGGVGIDGETNYKAILFVDNDEAKLDLSGRTKQGTVTVGLETFDLYDYEEKDKDNIKDHVNFMHIKDYNIEDKVSKILDEQYGTVMSKEFEYEFLLNTRKRLHNIVKDFKFKYMFMYDVLDDEFIINKLGGNLLTKKFKSLNESNISKIYYGIMEIFNIYNEIDNLLYIDKPHLTVHPETYHDDIMQDPIFKKLSGAIDVVEINDTKNKLISKYTSYKKFVDSIEGFKGMINDNIIKHKNNYFEKGNPYTFTDVIPELISNYRKYYDNVIKPYDDFGKVAYTSYEDLQKLNNDAREIREVKVDIYSRYSAVTIVSLLKKYNIQLGDRKIEDDIKLLNNDLLDMTKDRAYFMNKYFTPYYSDLRKYFGSEMKKIKEGKTMNVTESKEYLDKKEKKQKLMYDNKKLEKDKKKLSDKYAKLEEKYKKLNEDILPLEKDISILQKRKEGTSELLDNYKKQLAIEEAKIQKINKEMQIILNKKSSIEQDIINNNGKIKQIENELIELRKNAPTIEGEKVITDEEKEKYIEIENDDRYLAGM